MGNIKILSHVHELINMIESKLVQNIKSILEKEGKKLSSYIIREIPLSGKVDVVFISSGDNIIIRGKDSIVVREKKLKDFVSTHKEVVSVVSGDLKESEKPIKEPEPDKSSESGSANEIPIKEGDIEFVLLLSERNGKKYYTCPCNQTYDQKGHAKWNHIKRHLNRKSKNRKSE